MKTTLLLVIVFAGRAFALDVNLRISYPDPSRPDSLNGRLLTFDTIAGRSYYVRVAPTPTGPWTTESNITLATGTTMSLSGDTLGYSSPTFQIAYTRALRPGFNQNALGLFDDFGSKHVTLPFLLKFRDAVPWSQVWVNNNGTISFDTDVPEYTPFSLAQAGAMIAPFFADVDTQGGLVPGYVDECRYGPSMITLISDGTQADGTPIYKQSGGVTYDGKRHNAWGVTWHNVGYFLAKTDHINDFQLILIQREDIPNDNAFDVEMNYDQIQWETGDAQQSEGYDGLGGHPARAGISDGRTLALEFAGSATSGGYLDMLLDPYGVRLRQPNPKALVARTNVSPLVPGRLRYQIRNGKVPRALSVGVETGHQVFVPRWELKGGVVVPIGDPQPSIQWTLLVAPPGSIVRFETPNALHTFVDIDYAPNYGENDFWFEITATSAVDPNITAKADVEWIFYDYRNP